MTAPHALLSFHLGPVQPFIEAAKTTRDLWAGSFLVSWLVDAAMRPLRDQPGTEFVSPRVKGDPLAGLVPCLPNRFLARVPDADAADLVVKVRRAFDKAWEDVCKAVHKGIAPKLAKLDPKWDALWEDQLRAPFEVRVVSTPTFGRGDLVELEQAARLLDAVRAVRHVPPYAVPPEHGDVPQKCTLLGTYEQMGPANLDASRAFWRDAANNANPPPEPYRDGKPRRPGVTVSGGRITAGERLCAVSLVKRFAWVHFFVHQLRGDEKADEFVHRVKPADTATSAAREWLALGDGLPWETWLRKSEWSGQWLHWGTPNQDKDDPCPPHVWERIQEHRRKHGPPPPYLALIAADADHLGDKWRDNPERVSEAVAAFVDQVNRIVGEHHGELIYTGGDNTLAVCPAAHAVRLAQKLETAFQAAMPGAFTLSAGVAIVHHKEDLRFALKQVRDAEKRAKNAGRDRLALTVCRRSGEHATVDLRWPAADKFNALVDLYVRTDVTDRWAYKLRELMPTLAGVPLEVFNLELARVLAKTDGAGPLTEAVNGLYREFLTGRSAFDPTAEPFVTLCQSASFLARGRDR